MERVRKMLRSPVNIVLAIIKLLVMVVLALSLAGNLLSLFGVDSDLHVDVLASIPELRSIAVIYVITELLALAALVLSFLRELGIVGTILGMNAKFARLASSMFKVFMVFAIISFVLSLVSYMINLFNACSGTNGAYVFAVVIAMVIASVIMIIYIRYLKGWKNIFEAVSYEIERWELDSYPQAEFIAPFAIMMAVIFGIAGIVFAVKAGSVFGELKLSGGIIAAVMFLVMLYFILIVAAYKQYCKAHFSGKDQENA